MDSKLLTNTWLPDIDVKPLDQAKELDKWLCRTKTLTGVDDY